MKIITTMRSLPIGGSIITALELAAAMIHAGHDVTVVAGDGPARDLAAELGVPTVTSGGGPRRFAATLHREIRRQRPDVVHGWDWQAIAMTHSVATAVHSLPMIGSITAIDPTPFLPDGIPVGFVSEVMRRRDPRSGSPNFTQNMPINTDTDRPGIVDADELRDTLGLHTDRVQAVLVTRMAYYMKLESILACIGAMEHLSDLPIDLTVVGGGEAEADVRQAADDMNRTLGETRVRLTGELMDPRPAYDLADVALGMGSSILRGMSFGAPAVVLGEDGFALGVTPDTVDAINAVGYYGLGHGSAFGAKQVASQIAELVEDRPRAAQLGAFSREHVVEHHDTTVVAAGLLDQLNAAHEQGPIRSLRACATHAVRLSNAAGNKVARTVRPTPAGPHDHKPQEYRELI